MQDGRGSPVFGAWTETSPPVDAARFLQVRRPALRWWQMQGVVVNAVQAWESIAALARPLRPYDDDRRASLERILRITEEAAELHAASDPLREIATLAATALPSSEMKAWTG